MNLSLKEYCLGKLQEIESEGLLRKMRSLESQDARIIRSANKEFLNFSSNDYLGLSTHPQLREALEMNGDGPVGAAASRLITGNHPIHETLETEIARYKKKESALVFTSGYAAAVGTIPALAGKGDFIVMDKLCHASLVDGARLSGATLRVYPHLHLKRCGELLKSCRSQAGNKDKVLLITESVFSMDGDLAPLSDLVELKNRYGAWLMVDEAHATGVLGENGRGGEEFFGIEGCVDISMGTLSKALGCVGGFICGSQELKELLINRARSFIYSTGLPIPICKAALAALRVIQQEPERRKKLQQNIETSKKYLKLPVQSPIIPWIVGDGSHCMKLAEKLREEWVMIPAVRYPTVARGKARLRISLNAMHTEEDIAYLAKLLKSV